MPTKTCTYCGHKEKFHYHKQLENGNPLPCCPSCPNGMCEPNSKYLATLSPKLRAQLEADIKARRQRHGQA